MRLLRFDTTPQAPLVFIGYHLIFWWIIVLIAQGNGPLHGDMLEAHYWGQNPALGYYKHPPFWAWVTFVWFMILPQQNWAYLLLCSANVGIGLIAIWHILARYSSSERLHLAFLLIFLTPFYTFLTFQFNANTIFYSLWPCALLFFLKALEDQNAWASWLFGLFGALMMLSKYSALFLLITCLVVSLLHPYRNRYFRSSAPWNSLLVMMILCAPHLYWLHSNGYQPLTYVEGKLNNDTGFVIRKAFDFLVGLGLQHTLVVGLILYTFYHVKPLHIDAIPLPPHRSILLMLSVLTFAPVIFFLLGGLLVSIKLSVNLTNPFLFLIPLFLVMQFSDNQVRWLLPRVRNLVMAIFAIALLAAPIASIVMFRFTHDRVVEPLVELAEEAQRLWSASLHAPLKFVTSRDGSSASLSFYAKDHPRQWIDMDFKKSPWLSKEDICRDGVLALCARNSISCNKDVQSLAPEQAIIFHRTVKRIHLGMSGPDRDYTITIFPPGF